MGVLLRDSPRSYLMTSPSMLATKYSSRSLVVAVRFLGLRALGGRVALEGGAPREGTWPTATHRTPGHQEGPQTRQTQVSTGSEVEARRGSHRGHAGWGQPVSRGSSSRPRLDRSCYPGTPAPSTGTWAGQIDLGWDMQCRASVLSAEEIEMKPCANCKQRAEAVALQQ